MAIRHRHQARGFTLVELLVVITIIGMLMALLLPAVNAAVEAARNVQCKNNVGQLSKAANVYQADKNHYPGYENELTDTRVGTWVLEMLPQIDRLDLYALYTDDTATLPNPIPYMELLVCPSDPPEQISGPILSYVANSGWEGQVYTGTGHPNSADTAVRNGIFHNVDVRTNVDHLKDGLSYTLMFTENVQARKNSGSGDGWAALGGGNREATTFVWHKGNTYPANGGINDGNTLNSISLILARPSSFHTGGVNVAFADTRVIFLKDNIEIEVYRQLMTPYHSQSDANDQNDPVLDEAEFKK